MPPYRKRRCLTFEEELLESNITQELLVSEVHSKKEECKKQEESEEEDVIVVKYNEENIIVLEDEEEVIVVEDDGDDKMVAAEDEEVEVLEVEHQAELAVMEDEDDEVTFVEKKDKEKVVVIEDEDDEKDKEKVVVIEDEDEEVTFVEKKDKEKVVVIEDEDEEVTFVENKDKEKVVVIEDKDDEVTFVENKDKEKVVVMEDEDDEVTFVEQKDKEEVVVTEDEDDKVTVEEEKIQEEEKAEEGEKEENEADEKEDEKHGKETSFISTFSLKSSISSTFSLIQGTPGKEEGHTSNVVSVSQSPQRTYPLSTLFIYSDEHSTIREEEDEVKGGEEEEEKKEEEQEEEEENVFPLQVIDSETLWEKLQTKNVTDVVNLMILKYRMKEPITKLEMLKVVTEEDRKEFPKIFMEASNCLYIIFGIDIKENDPVNQSYTLTNSLNLTYEDEGQRMPTNGFLILILGVVFMEENCASEESIWKFLSIMGVYNGEEHFVYGDPTKLLTGAFIEQNYLEYQQVANSEPPRYVFQWGPRAYAETTKMKVLEFLAKVTGRDPISFSLWYEEAFRDDEDQRSGRRYSRISATHKPISQNKSATAARSEESMSESVYTVSEENRQNLIKAGTSYIIIIFAHLDFCENAEEIKQLLLLNSLVISNSLGP
ncbi:MAGE protein containing protein [Cricetulus griseus]|uniref:MAGE protein containing protein n=1 Tax=Cricetulus griseus TaxID=10029 RepID=A0A061HVC1_CRIGR|nr:MAGE protein containing protein [Cricetulus griseus]